MKTPSGHLTVTELAAKLGVAVGTLRNWRVKRRGPRGVRVMGRVYYPLEEVYKWRRKHGL